MRYKILQAERWGGGRGGSEVGILAREKFTLVTKDNVPNKCTLEITEITVQLCINYYCTLTVSGALISATD